MSLPVHATITRDFIRKALADAGISALDEQIHARPLSIWDDGAPGTTCMALEIEDILDLATFLVALTKSLPPKDSELLADCTRLDGSVCYWRGWVLESQPGIPEQARRRTPALL